MGFLQAVRAAAIGLTWWVLWAFLPALGGFATEFEVVRGWLGRLSPFLASLVPMRFPVVWGLALTFSLLAGIFFVREVARLMALPRLEIVAIGADSNPWPQDGALEGFRLAITNTAVAATAENANVFAEIFKADGRQLFSTTPGDGLRWADLSGLNTGNSLEKRFTSVDPRTTRMVNLFQSHPGTGTFLLRAESFMNNHPYAENPRLRISPGTYAVKVTARAKEMETDMVRWLDLKVFDDKPPEVTLRPQ